MSLPNSNVIPTNGIWPVELKPLYERSPDAPTAPDLAGFTDVTLYLFGVPSSVQTEPFGYGLFNEVYLLTLDVPSTLTSTIPRQVVARITRPIKVNSDISMESEIATMLYVKRHTSIPIPTVFGYCKSEDSPVGLPFMIMEIMEGVSMGRFVWSELDMETKLTSIRHYSAMVVELSRLRFDSIGSLYPGDTTGTVELGPMAWPKFETPYRRTLPIYDRGPWKSATAWLQASLTDTIQFMELNPELARNAPIFTFKDEELWKLAHTLLPRCLKLVPEIVDEASDPYAGQFALTHMDFTPWNFLYYDSGPNKGKISAVLDWEMAATVPLWSLVAAPWWFQDTPVCVREPEETRVFEETYFECIQAEDPVLGRLARASYSKRRFAEAANVPWSPATSQMREWMENWGDTLRPALELQGGSV